MSHQLRPPWWRTDYGCGEGWRREIWFVVSAVVPVREPWHGGENNKEGMTGRRVYQLSIAIAMLCNNHKTSGAFSWKHVCLLWVG